MCGVFYLPKKLYFGVKSSITKLLSQSLTWPCVESEISESLNNSN